VLLYQFITVNRSIVGQNIQQFKILNLQLNKWPLEAECICYINYDIPYKLQKQNNLKIQ